MLQAFFLEYARVEVIFKVSVVDLSEEKKGRIYSARDVGIQHQKRIEQKAFQESERAVQPSQTS
jgi:hypothetical protein